MVGKITLWMISNVVASSSDFLDKQFFQKSKVLDSRFMGSEEKRNEQMNHQKDCSCFVNNLLKRYNEIEKNDPYLRKSQLGIHQKSLQNLKTFTDYNEHIEAILSGIKNRPSA